MLHYYDPDDFNYFCSSWIQFYLRNDLFRKLGQDLLRKTGIRLNESGFWKTFRHQVALLVVKIVRYIPMTNKDLDEISIFNCKVFYS